MIPVTALVSAYYADQFIQRRLENLKNTDTVVVCQQNSQEHKIAYGYDVDIIVTPDIPTVGAAWNLAAKKAQGEYLTTANTDDLWRAEGLALQFLVEKAKHVNADVCFSSVMLNGEEWRRIQDKEGFIDNPAKRLEKHCFIGPMPIWKRSLHERYGYFNEEMTVCADYDFWLRLARAGVSFYYIDFPHGIYTKRMDSLEHRNRNLIAHENRIARLDKRAERLRDN